MTFRQRTEHPILRRLGSTTTLIIIAVALGAALAAALGTAVWLIAAALHHASSA